jgi:DNA-binding NtrC family response regulator
MPDLLTHDDWPGGTRARVLVEATEWTVRETIEVILQGAGYRTLSCAGPEGSGQRCGLASDQGCPAAMTADLVVHALRVCDARNLEALRALRRRRPEMPVVVEASAAVAVQRADDFAGCSVIEAPLTAEALLEAVEDALSDAG